mmetsp:Transcript_10583/g.32530  ORF Transcript_10583/g.32530 Transcript_10583/m.32530 type:complete len:99 (-) Transcript_10583:131-427(-)
MPCSYPLAVALSPEVTQRMCSGREMRARIPSYGRECGSITRLAAERIVCVASLSPLVPLLVPLLVLFLLTPSTATMDHLTRLLLLHVPIERVVLCDCR